MKKLILPFALFMSAISFSQIGIGTTNPDNSAILDVTSTSKGFLTPRMTHAEKTAIIAPATGLILYCSDCSSSGELQIFNGTSWVNMIGGSASFAKPGTPTSAVATAGNLQASVAFTAPLSDGGSAITGYTVTSSPGSFTSTGASSPLVVTGLTVGTAYTFTVVATNVAGNSLASIASASVTPYTVPDAPTSVVAIPGNTQASVSFSVPTSNGGSAITGYTVSASSGGVTSSGTTSPLLVTGLTSGTAYTFTVVATNTAGNSVASIASGSVTPAIASGSAICNNTTITDVVEITSPSAKVWMDRNLGASRTATSSTDFMAYGCLYQWGRGNDGHASITWTSSTARTAVNGTITTLSSTDTPGNGNFIRILNSPYDWRSGQNNNLWQGVAGINNPCWRSGYRLPTEAELNAERLIWTGGNNSAGAFASPLKLSMSGYRLDSSGSFSSSGTAGEYWSSSISTIAIMTRSLNFVVGNASMGSNYRAYAAAVRCIKD
jgi:hypothetical protein